jgi:hypothetical protein
MLTNSENEGIVQSKTLALRLSDVQIVSLRMGRWMSGQEFIGWIISCMDDGQRERERVRNIFDRVHQTPLTGVYFQDALTFITRK